MRSRRSERFCFEASDGHPVGRRECSRQPPWPLNSLQPTPRIPPTAARGAVLSALFYFEKRRYASCSIGLRNSFGCGILIAEAAKKVERSLPQIGAT
eukprot:4897528-Prymnesium_polylepis.1